LIGCGVLLLYPGWASGPDTDEDQEKAMKSEKDPVNEVSAESQAQPAQMAQSVTQPVATVIFSKGNIEQVLQAISLQTGVTVIAKGQAVGQRVDIIAKDEPLEVILDKLTSGKDWVWHKVNDTRYEIMDRRTYETTVLPKQRERKIFQPRYIKAEDFKNAIEGMLTKNIGKVAVDPRTNKVIVTDLPQVIEMIARLLEEIDVKPIVRVFYIRHADVDEIARMLERYKSAPGSIEADSKTHQIIVTDTLHNIKRMELLVEVLDIGPEMRIYNINNIGFEGEVLQDLSKAIERVVTKDAFWEINYRAGTLLVEDVTEVHEKIEKILAAFDRPSKQVLIEAEVIETGLEREFNLGVDYDLSQDLFSAVQDGLFEGQVPTGSGDVTDDLGFINLREEFPIVSLINKGGLQVSYLSTHLRAQLNAFMSDTDTKLLIQPRLLVKNQEEATIFVGGEVPYLTTFFDRPSGGTDFRYSQFTQNTVNEGTMVKIRPSISNNDLIEMYVKLENNKAEEVTRDAGAQGSIELVGRRRQEVETVLVIPSDSLPWAALVWSPR
jgi:type II secretory pathway component GspD/PulD (secretin)